MKRLENNRHNNFGGIIDINDFSTNTPNKKRINNQIEAELLQNVLLKKKKEKDWIFDDFV